MTCAGSAESQSFQKLFQIKKSYLFHKVRLRVPLCAHKRAKRAFHSLEYPTACNWSLEAFPYSLLCGTASFHVHIKRGSQKFTHNLGVTCMCALPVEAVERQRRGTSHKPLKLHTYCSEAPGMGTRSVNTSPRKMHFALGSTQRSLHSSMQMHRVFSWWELNIIHSANLKIYP